MRKRNVLLLGNGGREHAFAWKISQSRYCENLHVIPGNPGTAQHGTNHSISLTDFAAIEKFVVENKIDIVVVGPELPLVEGIFDYFRDNENLKQIPVIGPSQKGAMLEGSKAYSKAFMLRHNIPTAAYKEFTQDDIEEGLKYIDIQQTPVVLKADGLAAGKGVIIAASIEEARSEFAQMLDGKFGDASAKVVIEEFMDGIEFSVFVLTDGFSYQVLPTAKDYKRIGEGDTGLNTGGMGAVSPPAFVTEEMMKTVDEKIIQPTIKGLEKDGIVYHGFVYIGLMVLKNGDIKVVEYNCRMGDPETEAVFPRWKNDIIEVFSKLVDGELESVEIETDEKAAVTIILASGGYPGDFEKSIRINGLEDLQDSLIFHAGTRIDESGNLVTNGGRVLAVTSLHKDWKEAVRLSNKAAEQINFKGKYFRTDIGFDL